MIDHRFLYEIVYAVSVHPWLLGSFWVEGYSSHRQVADPLPAHQESFRYVPRVGLEGPLPETHAGVLEHWTQTESPRGPSVPPVRDLLGTDTGVTAILKLLPVSQTTY